MSTFLKYNPKINGLSKNKIRLVLLILFVVIIILVLFGVSKTDSGSDYGPTIDNTEHKYALKDSQNEINQMLLASSRAESKIVATQVKSNASSTEEINVPPIAKVASRISEVDMDSRTNSSKFQYNKKLEELKYRSYSAKSLLYSKPLVSNESGASNSDKQNTSNNSQNALSKSQLNNASDVDNSNKTDNAKGAKFLKSATGSDNYLAADLVSAKSPYEIKAGSIIPATMINGLNSDLPGQIVAQVRQNIYDSVGRQYLLIPQGARLIGLYDSNIAYGQNRVLVIWNRLIYPNGDSINLKGMPGTDLQGYAGFHDIVDNKYWQIFGTSFIMGVITGAMQYSQNNTNANVQIGGLGLSNANPTVGQTLAGSLGQQLGQTGLTLAQKNLNVQPTLIIRPGYPFNVMLTADMVLAPYRQK